MEGGITVILTPDRNSPKKSDLTGAFKPEARKFCQLHGISTSNIVEIDISKPNAVRRREVLNAIKQTASREGGLNTVVFFCHGFRRGIQLGFRLAHVDSLAKTISQAAGHDFPSVLLYACSSASSHQSASTGGDGGFCDELRDSICKHGSVFVRVMGHSTAGHTTRNPYVRFFEGGGLPRGGTGGFWVVRPNGPLWRKWRQSLRAGDLRFQFPFMEVNDIRQQLS